MFELHINKNDYMESKQDECGDITIHGFDVHYFLQKTHYSRGYNVRYFCNGHTFKNLLQVNNYIESICDEDPLWQKM